MTQGTGFATYWQAVDRELAGTRRARARAAVATGEVAAQGELPDGELKAGQDVVRHRGQGTSQRHRSAPIGS